VVFGKVPKFRSCRYVTAEDDVAIITPQDPASALVIEQLR
jgi:hypothetical protein